MNIEELKSKKESLEKEITTLEIKMDSVKDKISKIKQSLIEDGWTEEELNNDNNVKKVIQELEIEINNLTKEYQEKFGEELLWLQTLM